MLVLQRHFCLFWSAFFFPYRSYTLGPVPRHLGHVPHKGLSHCHIRFPTYTRTHKCGWQPNIQTTRQRKERAWLTTWKIVFAITRYRNKLWTHPHSSLKGERQTGQCTHKGTKRIYCPDTPCRKACSRHLTRCSQNRMNAQTSEHKGECIFQHFRTAVCISQNRRGV